MAGAALAASLAAVPSPAAAAPGLVRIVQDDRSLLRAGTGSRDATLDELRAAGADVVRVNLVWRELDRRPAAWRRVDGLLAAARARGLRVLATVTTPAPTRYTRPPALSAAANGPVPGVWRPRPVPFARFAARAARRWRGDVWRWSVVNEPNNARFLMPQRDRRGRPASPGLYRGLLRQALPALRRAGVPGRRVLIGDVAGLGQSGGTPTSAVEPLTFARLLLARGPRVDAGGWAVHPYYARGGPFERPGRTTTLWPGRLRPMLRVLDAAHRRGRLTRRLDLFDTEDGVQTNPPDRAVGVTPATQARYVNETEARLWRTPRVRSFTQYLWRDDAPRFGFQSGVRFADGRAKPLFAAYAFPAAVDRGRLWVRLPPGQTTAQLLGPGTRVRTLRTTRRDRVVVTRVTGRGAIRVVAGAASSRVVSLPGR